MCGRLPILPPCFFSAASPPGRPVPSVGTSSLRALRPTKPALNIISEKETVSDSNEIVDDRYGKEDYASGHKVQIGGESKFKRKIRTSVVCHIRMRLFEGNRLVTTGGGVL